MGRLKVIFRSSFLIYPVIIALLVGFASCRSTDKKSEAVPAEEIVAVSEEAATPAEAPVAEPSKAEEVKAQVAPEVAQAEPLPVKELSKFEQDSQAFNHKIYLLASEISTNLKEYDPSVKTVVVASMVDLEALDSTSPFGRFVTERLIHELHRSGYRVYEMRQSREIEFTGKSGEFALTREGEELLNRYQSDAIVVGTYSLVNGILTLHTRMVEHETSRVISVASLAFDISLDEYAKSLYKVTDQSKGVEVSLVPLRGSM